MTQEDRNEILLDKLKSDLIIETAVYNQLSTLTEKFYLPAQETLKIKFRFVEIQRQITELQEKVNKANGFQ